MSRIAVPQSGLVDTYAVPTRARRPRLGNDGRRPRVQAWHPGAPGGRPAQPEVPIVAASYVISAQTLAEVSAATSWSTTNRGAGTIRLTERGLMVLAVGFVLAVVLGAAVVVGQYLALGVG